MGSLQYSLAHLSDPHLPFDPALSRSQPPRLTLKQRMALLSWQRKRRQISTLLPDEPLLADLAALRPDHVAVTGDLVNLGLRAEYEPARCWIARFGPADRVSVVPGNHDLTAPIDWLDGPGCWRAFMSGDDGDGDNAGASFPFLRRRGPLALIGLCSGVPTRPGSAAGRLGHRQIDRAAGLLDRARADGLFRVVLIHHPPLRGPGGPRKALRDRGSFVRMLGRHGAELVLHGHHHLASLSRLHGPDGETIPVFGAPAALAAVPRPELSGWLLHTIEERDNQWRLRSTLRRFDPLAGRFIAHAGWTHLLPRVHHPRTHAGP